MLIRFAYENLNPNRKPTIWDNLVKKLGRDPTNAECRDECHRITREANIDLATAGKLKHQKRKDNKK